MSHPSLEDDIRAALHQRAHAAPAPRNHPMPQLLSHRRGVSGRVIAIGAAAACVAVIAAVAVNVDRQDSQVTASGSQDTGTPQPSDSAATPRDMPTAPVPRLGFDSPGFTFEPVMDCADGAAPLGSAPAPRARPVFQSFGRSYHESPLFFLRTLSPSELDNFGLLDAQNDDAFELRGATGYAARERAADRGWNLSAQLPDGSAIYAIVLGLELDAVTAILDGLTPRADGGWSAEQLPAGMRELAQSEVSEDGAYYSAGGTLPEVSAGSFEVNLYNDAFDQRLADRAASTTGAVEAVTVDGVPAALGSYRHDDHWVMFEPQPGRTMEIRASSMTRQEVENLLERAVFVDEQTWRTMCSGA